MANGTEQVEEFSQLAQDTHSVENFYRQVLPRLTSRLSAAGTAVWTCDDESIKPFLKHGVDALPANGKLDRHQSLLEKVHRAGQPAYVLPKSADAPTDNPTDYVLGICPVKVDDTVVALIESFQPGDASSDEREASLRLLRSVAGIAGRFHRQSELRELREHQIWWEQFDLFAQSVHASLNPIETAYAIANDGRRIIGCDRLSVVVPRGRKCRVTAVSGQASVNRRANAIVLLERLAARVALIGEPFHYPADADVAPQLEEAVESYVDIAETSSLLIVPLIKQRNEADDRDEGSNSQEIIGALVAEQFSGDPISSELVSTVARHASTALSNALEHRRIFLLPLWSALGKLFGQRYLSKTVLGFLLLVAVTLALVFVPADFDLSAEGTLQPEHRRYVFAEADGVVDQLHVKHGSAVAVGEELVKLRGSDIDLKLAEIRGELETTSKKLTATKATRIANSTTPGADRNRINQFAAEEEELRRWMANLRLQQELLMKRKESLVVRSPIHGEVTTWDVENLLAARPVTRGDILMTLATTDGPWVVEVLLSDRRTGHLRDAQLKQRKSLDVTYILATNPGKELHGKLQQIGGATVVDQQEGLALPVTIEVDEEDIKQSRPGAKVIAKIHCGQASLGYVWLHEIFEFVQTRVLFRF